MNIKEFLETNPANETGVYVRVPARVAVFPDLVQVVSAEGDHWDKDYAPDYEVTVRPQELPTKIAGVVKHSTIGRVVRTDYTVNPWCDKQGDWYDDDYLLANGTFTVLSDGVDVE